MQRQGSAERGQQGGKFEYVFHDFNCSTNLLDAGSVRMRRLLAWLPEVDGDRCHHPVAIDAAGS
jgi:hypothetical protein